MPETADRKRFLVAVGTIGDRAVEPRSGVAENGLKRIDLATLDHRARRRRSRADRIERREVERERSDLNPVPFTESGRSCVNSRKIATGQHRLRRNSEAMVVAAWRPMPVWRPVMPSTQRTQRSTAGPASKPFGEWCLDFLFSLMTD